MLHSFDSFVTKANTRFFISTTFRFLKAKTGVFSSMMNGQLAMGAVENKVVTPSSPALANIITNRGGARVKKA
jgi:hypothetical protein